MSQQLTLAESFAKGTKHLSNPHQDSKKLTHLRKKRNLDKIEQNYLLRRFYKSIDTKNEYETEFKSYSILNNYEFDLPPYNKFSCIKNISANAFWFLFCSNYFPYLSNQLIDQKEYIPEELKKLIDCLNMNILPIKKNSDYLHKFNFPKELQKIVQKFLKKKNEQKEKNNLFQTSVITTSTTTPSSCSNSINLDENKSNNNINISNLSCTSNISSIKSLLENLIKYFEHKNESIILSKINKDFILTNNFKRDNRIEENIDLDIKYQTNSFKKLREEILDKEEQDEEDENDDIVCYVCGDGEYEDDNLILYCSLCNMTVHQKCNGIMVIPEEDWICHLCKAFNDEKISKNMECILCSKLGGAMKPCTLKKSSHSYKVMIKYRENPFLKDNNFKNINLNNNLINNISNEIKDEKNVESTVNDNESKNENKLNNINENLNENISNFSSGQIPEVPKSTTANQINNPINNTINDLNSNENIPSFLSPINNNNANNNINNNISSPSLNSSNIIKETSSINSNSSMNNNTSLRKSEKFESSTHNTHIISSLNIHPSDPKNTSSNNIQNKKHLQKKQKNEIYLNDKIAKENAWVHLSCALWLPEINIKNFDLKEKIQGVESISKKRLLEKCDICLKIGYGPTIKCEKCEYRFHPECARRLKRFYLEINENENAETTFVAYCNSDAPPKHLKKYELIKQRKIDDIKKFSILIRKDLGNLNKIPEDKQCNIINPLCYCNNSSGNNYIDKKGLIEDESKIWKKLNDVYMKGDININNKKSINNTNNNMKIELTGAEKKNLLNAVREMLIDQSNLALEINSEDYSIKENTNIHFSYDEINFPERFSWVLLKESQEYLDGFSPFEIFNIFRSLVKSKQEFSKLILKERIKSSNKKNNEIIQQPVEKKQEYCICDYSHPDENWIGCENDENGDCPGKKWYHLSCMPELKEYGINNTDMFSKVFEKYYCPSCRKKYGFKNVFKNQDNNNEQKENKEIKEDAKDSNSNEQNNINNNELNNKSTKEIEFVNINENSSKDNKINAEINTNENNSKMEIEEENNKKEEIKEDIKENIKE